jgi:hypothetical protein
MLMSGQVIGGEQRLDTAAAPGARACTRILLVACERCPLKLVIDPAGWAGHVRFLSLTRQEVGSLARQEAGPRSRTQPAFHRPTLSVTGRKALGRIIFVVGRKPGRAHQLAPPASHETFRRAAVPKSRPDRPSLKALDEPRRTSPARPRPGERMT